MIRRQKMALLVLLLSFMESAVFAQADRAYKIYPSPPGMLSKIRGKTGVTGRRSMKNKEGLMNWFVVQTK
jgi:hypothetical protein